MSKIEQISRPRASCRRPKGLKGRDRGQMLPKIRQKIGKIKFARFGPNMAHLAIGTVTAGLAQKNRVDWASSS